MTELEKELLRAVEALAIEQQSAQSRMDHMRKGLDQTMGLLLQHQEKIKGLESFASTQTEQLERLTAQLSTSSRR
jgi:hypothetical protein